IGSLIFIILSCASTSSCTESFFSFIISATAIADIAVISFILTSDTVFLYFYFMKKKQLQKIFRFTWTSLLIREYWGNDIISFHTIWYICMKLLSSLGIGCYIIAVYIF